MLKNKKAVVISVIIILTLGIYCNSNVNAQVSKNSLQGDRSEYDSGLEQFTMWIEKISEEFGERPARYLSSDSLVICPDGNRKVMYTKYEAFFSNFVLIEYTKTDCDQNILEAATDTIWNPREHPKYLNDT
jgi:hypothetical protein